MRIVEDVNCDCCWQNVTMAAYVGLSGSESAYMCVTCLYQALTVLRFAIDPASESPPEIGEILIGQKG